MPDLITLGLGYLLAKDSLQKILGPTSEYIGDELKELTKRRVETIGKVFQNAEKKLGNDINNAGEVPPKVLKVIIDNGSYSQSNLETEYLGGILASSRTELGRDDRGARLAKIVDNMSVYQLRTHYLIYLTIKNIFSSKLTEADSYARSKMRIFIPLENYEASMDFNKAELLQINSILPHTFFGLSRDSLITDNFWFGNQEYLSKHAPNAPGGGIICEPSALGIELFLWAFGKADKPLNYIYDSNFVIQVDTVPNGFSTAVPLVSI
jgi:hypothetical protein